MASYLEQLMLRLATGAGNLPDEQRTRHAQFLRDCQHDDGGFGGREGGSDLYYTSFALRGLAILGELHGPVAEAAGSYLRSQLTAQTTMLDFVSLIYSGRLLETLTEVRVFADSRADWPRQAAALLETFRAADGGYAKSSGANAGSTYHTFLFLLCQQLLDVSPVEPERLQAFATGRQRVDGGFAETTAGQQSGTNPTAAAIGTLRILDCLTSPASGRAANFLLGMQTDEGGLRANTRIPIADLLSTFTGLQTLSDLGIADRLEAAQIDQFVTSLERPDGGFHAALWDDATDVEYTFYGLGTLALLASTA